MLVVVDSRCRVRSWEALRAAGYWSDVVALRCERSPSSRVDVPELVVGRERVDLGAALERLGHDHGARTVRVDSGGALAGALIDYALIDEISLLVHPRLVGSAAKRWYGTHDRGATLEPMGYEVLAEGLIWLRYRALHA